MKIIDGQTASDIYNGSALKTWVENIGNFFGDIAAKIGDAIDNFQIGDVKLGDWYRADPVGAIAGVTLGGTAMYLGGKLVMGVAGTVGRVISAVRSLGVLGAARAGATSVIRALGSRALAALGAPGALATRWLAGITTGAIIRWCTGGVVSLLNFNFNMTDQQLEGEIQSAQDNLWATAGSSFGSLLGTALCGVAPGAAIVRFNPAKLAAIKEVNEELYEEVMPQIKSLIMATVNVIQKITFAKLYKNVRKMIKSQNSFIRFLSPSLADAIDKWGAPGSKPWTINSAVEEKIEQIEDKGLQAFAENAWEEFVDSCTESLFVLSTAFG